MDYKEIEKKYRPVPFWSWNDKLNTEETILQVNSMNDVGIGGFFMHARGGLQTEYMGKEWFENVNAAIGASGSVGMKPWAYDENGWPSGFGNGKVNGLGVKYQQKYLRISEHEPCENVICKCGKSWFYFEVNPYYVDVLDKEVIRKFIDAAYEPYYKKLGNDIEGFFTDEPQVSRNGIPWSFVFEKEYKERYSQNITDHLEELFLPVQDYKNTRIKFWKMVTELFSENFFKQIYEWCDERNLKFTGHIALEESILSQLVTSGSCMAHYEFFHIPGMDWLGRKIFECLTPMQVSSVAQQLGRSQVLSETFALCGHNVSFAELKGIFEWQMVRGINLLCQHLEGYSIRGMRKRDYPPAMYYQQPWWKEYREFNESMSRIGMILSKGKVKANVLLIHPMTTAWTLYDDNQNAGIEELDKKLLQTMRTLEEKHIIYHLGDEIIMKRHAYVKDDKIIIGSQEYEYIIDSCCEILLPETQNLISTYKAQGGKIITADELAENNVVNENTISYTKRYFDNYNVHYFVNTSSSRKEVDIAVHGKILDIWTGDLIPFTGRHEFEPWGSLMIIEDGSKNITYRKRENIVKLEGFFKLTKPVQNMYTLDKCDYYFDGKLIEKDGYVLNICERANKLKQRVKIHQDYHIYAEYLPEKIELVCETPELFNIKVNGDTVDKNITGWIIDKSFKKIDITRYLREGRNTISFDCNFKQSSSVYDGLQKAEIFETEKNKLVYDMEIEAIYLLGNFALKTDGKWEELNRNALRYNGAFVITKAKDKLNLKNIEKQGYPFFCGTLELEGNIDISENDVIEFDMQGVNVISVEIGNIKKNVLTDKRLRLSDFGILGKTKIKITVSNNLRNLLGPHHLAEGESQHVSPASFYKELCLWNRNDVHEWSDGYCFCKMSI